ncbi:PAS domain-containing protein [Flaviaesturariibacter amylovorans]|uniref:PAS domain-containing protein n=1 Tax=Flaviaesturariibacter amylovorans TaxID=1084520 RepID=A0ABP8HNG7_9BACT
MKNTPDKTIYGAPEFMFALTDLCGLLLEASADAVLAIDTRFRVVLFNDAAERILHKTRGAVLGQSLFHLLPELGDDDGLEYLGAALRGERPEGARALQHGRRRLSWQLWPMTDKFGSTHGVLCVLRETARHEERITALEQALLERDLLLGSRARMAETIIDASSDLIMVVDKGLRYSAGNKALQEYCGRSASDLVGQGLLDCFPALAGTSQLEYIYAAFDGKRTELQNVPRILKEGHCDLSILPLDYGGHIYGVLVIAHSLRQDNAG